MDTPCWRCGATKLEPIEGPVFFYWPARALGLQLCSCAGCHRLRLSRRSDWDFSKPNTHTEIVCSQTPSLPWKREPEPDTRPMRRCPYCGSPDIQRLPH